MFYVYAALRSAADCDDASKISAGLCLPASRQSAKSSSVHIHSVRLLRGHVGSQEHQNNVDYLSAHGKQL